MLKADLSPLAREHLPAMFDWIGHPSIRDGILLEREVDAPSHERWFNTLAGDRSQALFAATIEGRHVGIFGFRNLSDRHKSGEMFMYVAPEHQGKRFGSAILAAGLAKGFNDLSLRKIYLEVHTNNLAAITIYGRAGFKSEGILVAEQLYKGQPVDMMRMGRVRDVGENFI